MFLKNTADGSIIRPVPAYKLYGIALLFFVLAAFIPHMANISKFSSWPAGKIECSLPNTLWFHWIMKDKIINRDFTFTTDYIAYERQIFWQNYLSPVLAFPLYYLLKPALAYNLYMVLLFILAGFSCFLLVYELTGFFSGSVLAGLFFEINSYSTTTLNFGEDDVMTFFCIPLFLFFLVRALKHRNVGNMLAAGISLASAGYFNSYYFFFCLVSTGVFMLFSLIDGLNTFFKKHVGIYAVILLTGAALYIPSLFILPIQYKVVSDPQNLISPGMNMGTEWKYVFNINPKFYSKTSLDFLNFFVPLITRGDYLFEAVLYVGFVPFLLCIYGFKNKPLYWRELILIGVFGFLTALGPYLIINQKAGIILHKYAVPLPQMLFARFIPFFAKMSRPFRFIMLFYILLSAYSALGFKKLLGRLGITNRYAAITAAMAVFMLFLLEFRMLYPAAFQVKYQEFSVPELFKEMGRDKAKYSIMIVPDMRPPWEDRRMRMNFFIPASKPGKLIIDKSDACNIPYIFNMNPDPKSSYYNQEIFMNAAKISQIYQAVYYQKKVSGMKSMPLFYERLEDPEIIEREIASIRANNIKYIVFFTNALYGIGLTELDNFTSNISGRNNFELITSDRGLKIFKVSPASEIQ